MLPGEFSRRPSKPKLFNLIMDEIIKSVKNMCGYKMGKKNFNILYFADDAILIADNEDDLQRLVLRANNNGR